MRRPAIIAAVALALALAAAPASGLFRSKTVSGNLDSDANIEKVVAEKVPDPSDPNDDTLAQTAVDVIDQCGSTEFHVRIAGPQESLVELKLVDADTHAGKDILSDLRGQPGFDGDLVAALRERLLPKFENTPMTVTLRVGRSWPAHLPPESGTQLYRIIQEALTNAYRHGGASSAEGDLKTTENQVVCAVRDNGRGIAWLDDSKPLGMGIHGMKERAALLGGDVTIRNRPRGGTAVIAAFDKEG